MEHKNTLQHFCKQIGLVESEVILLMKDINKKEQNIFASPICSKMILAKEEEAYIIEKSYPKLIAKTMTDLTRIKVSGDKHIFFRNKNRTLPFHYFPKINFDKDADSNWVWVEIEENQFEAFEKAQYLSYENWLKKLDRLKIKT